MVTLLDHTVRTRRTSSATSTPRRTLARSPSRSARRLLTLPTSRSVKIVTTHCEESHQKVHHSTQVVGHDSKVVAHGHHG